jgi:hypothetical protein
MASSDAFKRVACDEESPEFFSASTSESEGTPRRRLWKAKVAAAVTFVACAASVAAYLTWRQTSDADIVPEAPPHNSARALLESSDMADVITQNYMSVWPDLKSGERRLHDEVVNGMRKITLKIKHTEPKVFEQLSELPLTGEQQDSILKVVGSMSDKRVQSVGGELAKIVQSSKLAGKKKWSGEQLKRQLEEAFEQNKTKLTHLRNEIVPAPLRSMVDSKWQMSFNPERMRLIRDSKDSWNFEINVEQPGSRRLEHEEPQISFKGSQMSDEDLDEYSTKFEQGLGVLSGLLEQARVALDQIDFVGESFDVDMKIPYWAKSLVGGLDFVSELADCVMRGASNEVKLMMCPMKYASAATDFLESFDNVMGIANGHFHGFGATTSIAPAAAGGSNLAQQPQYSPQQVSGLYR